MLSSWHSIEMGMGSARLSPEKSPEPAPLPALGKAVRPEEQRGPAPSQSYERLCPFLSPQRWDMGHVPAPGKTTAKKPLWLQ